jgi:allantoicase
VIDLASAALGGQVIHATDELFADRRHLVDPRPAGWNPETFTRDGKEYDGWETRRSRDREGLPDRPDDADHAVIRLGAPGRLHKVVVDTAHFTGNYPESASVEAVHATGFPTVPELAAMTWETVVPRHKLAGDTANSFQVVDDRVWTHVRLTIHPDGGVARFRAFGEAVPDPAFLTGTVDLAAAVNGGRLVDASNRFYSSPENLLLPHQAATIGGGWETARRRGEGNDWVRIALAGEGIVRVLEIDTTHFTGNAPGSAAVTSVDGAILLPRTRLLPDTPHRFLVATTAPVREVRVDVFPDGGLNRVRVWGELTPAGEAAIRDRWSGSLSS